ncbi:hypothetical protein [Saccharibacillus kuerlensis]|uniref:HEAT repeat domain-containing protein n=1 Tax=Saccharibacillus kuerlensis TaxID=459527 RepID=A0ABQ2KZE1_9BACL|nr:hypothetical protein [Saccharibacillus kuerlensis]GGN97817.1 hypothetical protein GCM10010969_16110 [Saccharibacillus kuerlensis]
MNVFRISPFICGSSRMEAFLQDCYVSIGYPGIGNLEQVGSEEVSKQLHRVYEYAGTKLERRTDDVELFVHGMEDGDYVLVPHGGSVWLGDLGDYYYREEYDSAEEATCHRRGVTWLGVLAEEQLSPVLRAWMTDVSEGTVVQFPLPTELAGLEVFAAGVPGGLLPGVSPNLPVQSGPPTDAVPRVNEETLHEAVKVLREALGSKDPQLRVRAAEALLRYAK